MTREKAFRDPKVVINRVYTKQGDQGETRLVGGQKVGKDEARIDTYGIVDELNAFVGVARQSAAEAMAAVSSEENRARLSLLGTTLLRVQHELFNLGSILATLLEDVRPGQPRVTEADVTTLERDMDACQEDLAPLRSFVLPGGSRLNADLHVCRTICRRAERRLVAHSREAAVDPLCIAYLNRLSDAFFVWSRWASFAESAPEVFWDPNQAAGGEKKSEDDPK